MITINKVLQAITNNTTATIAKMLGIADAVERTSTGPDSMLSINAIAHALTYPLAIFERAYHNANEYLELAEDAINNHLLEVRAIAHDARYITMQGMVAAC